MILTLTGKLKKKEGTVEISEKFKKREFVIETTDEYPQTILLQLTQDRVDLIESFAEGDDLSVNFNVRGREWTSPKDGSVKVFNSLEAWKIEKSSDTESSSANGGQAEAAFETADDSDLPF